MYDLPVAMALICASSSDLASSFNSNGVKSAILVAKRKFEPTILPLPSAIKFLSLPTILPFKFISSLISTPKLLRSLELAV